MPWRWADGALEIRAPAEELVGGDAPLRGFEVGGDLPAVLVLQAGEDGELGVEVDVAAGSCTSASRSIPSPTIAFNGRLASTATPSAAACSRTVRREAGTVVPLEGRARFEEVHRQLQDAEVVPRPPGFARPLEHAGEGRRTRESSAGRTQVLDETP